MKKKAIWLLVLTLVVGMLGGCSAFSDFSSSDYGAYVQSLLDVEYKGITDKYMELTEDTQENADAFYPACMEYWAYILADYFLIMSVFAGFGGQKFIPESLERVAALHSELEKRGNGAFIEIDGGIKLSNVRSVRDAGVSLAVAGSSVYGAEDPAAAIKALREA